LQGQFLRLQEGIRAESAHWVALDHLQDVKADGGLDDGSVLPGLQRKRGGLQLGIKQVAPREPAQFAPHQGIGLTGQIFETGSSLQPGKDLISLGFVWQHDLPGVDLLSGQGNAGDDLVAHPGCLDGLAQVFFEICLKVSIVT
jgi:hypothetical protein